MPHQNSVFHGLLKHIPWTELDRLVEKHKADPDERGFEQPRAPDRDAVWASCAVPEVCARSKRACEAMPPTLSSRRLHGFEVGTVDGQCIASVRSVCRASHSTDGAIAARLSSQNQRLRASDRFHRCAAEQFETRYGPCFGSEFCGAKAHIIYDPDADQPLYLMVTAANVNDITAAQQMPIEAGATYVFDLGYYDYGWWAKLACAGCRIVTRLKGNTPFAVVEDRPVASGIVDPE